MAALVAGTAVPVVASIGFALRDVTPPRGMLAFVLSALFPHLVVSAIAASAARIGSSNAWASVGWGDLNRDVRAFAGITPGELLSGCS